MEVAMDVQVHLVYHHAAADATQAAVALLLPLHVQAAQIVVAMDVIQDVVENVMAVVRLVVKTAVEMDVQEAVAHHVLERVIKVARLLVLVNVGVLHAQEFALIHAIGGSVMEVVPVRANLHAKEHV